MVAFVAQVATEVAVVVFVVAVEVLVVAVAVVLFLSKQILLAISCDAPSLRLLALFVN